MRLMVASRSATNQIRAKITRTVLLLDMPSQSHDQPPCTRPWLHEILNLDVNQVNKCQIKLILLLFELGIKTTNMLRPLQNRPQLFYDKCKRFIMDDCSLELTIGTVKKHGSTVIIKIVPITLTDFFSKNAKLF